MAIINNFKLFYVQETIINYLKKKVNNGKRNKTKLITFLVKFSQDSCVWLLYLYQNSTALKQIGNSFPFFFNVLSLLNFIPEFEKCLWIFNIKIAIHKLKSV